VRNLFYRKFAAVCQKTVKKIFFQSCFQLLPSVFIESSSITVFQVGLYGWCSVSLLGLSADVKRR